MVRYRVLVRTFIVFCLALTSVLAFAQNVKTKTIVTYPSAYAISPPLSELPIATMGGTGREVPGHLPLPRMMGGIVGPTEADPVLQTEVLPSVTATKGVDFDGLSDTRWAPSDTTIAVGPNHIVQTVASYLAVFNKLGTWLAGPIDLSTSFFGPLGGSCASYAIEPVASYDRMADRWVISALGTNLAGSYATCIGVSKTNDPTGAYWLYVYLPGTDQYDLGKVGVWPTASNSAYLATYNIWQNGQTSIGADLCGFDRTKMLKGDPNAAQLCQMIANDYQFLPADTDGPTAPADGTPGLFLTYYNNNPGQLELRKLTLNFAAGTASLSDATFINVANFDYACGNGGTCVPQGGTSQQLDSGGWETMPRMAYRTHPQAYAQCRGWLSAHLPDIPVLEVASTGVAAQKAAKNPNAAAIASSFAAPLYGLRVVEARIEDQPGNVTHFFVIGPDTPGPTGRDKTSILFAVDNIPGALYKTLKPLADRNLNMTRIVSRPAKNENWRYLFFVDLDGHQSDPEVAMTLEEVKNISAHFKLLGSFPRAAGVENLS